MKDKNKKENFFKKWSSEMAYLLGFFAADGCMIKNNRQAHFIEFHITDKDLLIKIRNLLFSNNKISEQERNANWKTAYKLQIGSKVIFEDLLVLGMTPNKSKTIKLPKIPNKYFHYFVLGYFDGDGNVYANEYQRKGRNKKSVTLLSGFTSGSEKFLKKLYKKLQEAAYLLGGSIFISSGAWHLYYSVKDSRKLYDFMYNKNNGLFLERKKRIFEKYFQSM
jgi:hypothetical protein